MFFVGNIPQCTLFNNLEKGICTVLPCCSCFACLSGTHLGGIVTHCSLHCTLLAVITGNRKGTHCSGSARIVAEVHDGSVIGVLSLFSGRNYLFLFSLF